MLRAFLIAVLLALPAAAPAQDAGSHAIEIPSWFTETFLDLREDVRDAAKDGRRLMLYFGQDGCPYCTRLMQVNFRQQQTVDRMKKGFVAVAINLWGDREVTGFDGKVMREKEFARALRIQFTPTLLFFDEKGATVARLNGYYPPHRLDAALDWVAGRMEKRISLAEHLKAATRDEASATLHPQSFFLAPPYDLRPPRGKAGAKPLAVLFETTHCAGCDELHLEGFKRPEVLAQVKRFDVLRLNAAGNEEVITRSGAKLRAADWARELKVIYTPTIVFFDPAGKEVFRSEAYMRPFHTAGSFEYVASRAYLKEPSFQRFLQGKSEQMRERGQRVELWK